MALTPYTWSPLVNSKQYGKRVQYNLWNVVQSSPDIGNLSLTEGNLKPYLWDNLRLDLSLTKG